ncbi:MAG: glycosyltransferase [Pseudomonadota bacterium]
MNTHPSISVVTAAYNAERFIADTIASVRRQSLADWEHIIVDDGSTDQTAAVAERAGDGRLRLIRQANAGQSAAQNAGIAAARGRRLVLLDADDLLREESLARLSAALDAEPEAVLAYGRVWLIDEEGGALGARRIFRQSPCADRLADILEWNFISTGVAMIRTDAMRRVGGYDPDLRMGQDWECWSRLAAEGPFASVGGEAVLEYRLRAGSMARLEGIDPQKTRPAVERIYAQPAVHKRFSEAEIGRMRRRCEAQIYHFSANEALRLGAYAMARRLFLGALRRNWARPKTWILFLCALVRFVPAPIAKRIGFEG